MRQTIPITSRLLLLLGQPTLTDQRLLLATVHLPMSECTRGQLRD